MTSSTTGLSKAGQAVLVALAGGVIVTAVGVHASASPSTSTASSPTRRAAPAPKVKPSPTATSKPTPTSTPTASPTPTAVPSSPASCYALSYNGQWYCSTTISSVKATSWGVGARVVLRDVSVTRSEGGVVTVAGLESNPCSPGMLCGALMTTVSLDIPWPGTTRPPVRSVINLFGTTVAGTLNPAGYVTTSGCYIDYC